MISKKYAKIIIYKYGDSNAKKKNKILQFIREKILSEEFKNKNKKSIQDFTRDRKLNFSKMIILMSRKSVKSIQNVLNEAETYLSNMLDEDLMTVSKSAYTQAREKINYEAFIELCNDIKEQFYKEYEYEKYKGFRLLGVDGSMIILPNNEDTKKEFSTTNVKNQYQDKNKEIVQARVSVLYDLLNNIVVDAIMSDSKIHEINITIKEHLKQVKEEDLVIFDRGYPSYRLFATITSKYEANYLIRMKTSMYKKYTKVLFDKNSDIEDITVTIKPTYKELKEICIKEDLPQEIKVRFVKVILDDGKIEVLATSVLDKNILKTEDLKELYFKRWGIETYYEIMKNRLSLENFTGTSALAVKQDFYATMFISNIEALVTFDLNEELKNRNKKSNKYEQKVNKSVSFNTIKNYAFELLYFPDKDIDGILDKIYQQLRTNKIAIRP
ncbi:MAG: IS4 family transposase, partial [Sulfurovaceae bacterium]|nr:IS4 family transposase [Sulfurovaceae bacterium]